MIRFTPHHLDRKIQHPATRPASARFGVARRLIACVLAAVALLAPAPSAGQKLAPNVSVSQPNGFVVQMPNKKIVSRRSGLQLEIDTRWINNYGYRPVRVRVTSPKPTTAEHTITIRLYVGSNHWSGGSTGVEQDFVMPLGSTSAETTIACPQYHAGHRYWWDVWVDGVKDDDLGVDMYTAWQFIAASAANPTDSKLKFLMFGAANSSKGTINPGADLFEALVLAVGDMPERWIDYTAFDVIALSPAELTVIVETQPQALPAILRWVRSGGQLWISNVGRNWERLRDIEERLGMATADSTDPFERGWKPIQFRSRRNRNVSKSYVHLPTGNRQVVSDPAVMAELERDADWIVERDADLPESDDDEDGEDGRALRTRRPADSSKWYVEQRLGLGTVRVFRRSWDPAGFALSWRTLMGIGVPQPDTTSSPATPIEGALNTVRNWKSRHGMTPDTANVDFANLLVPGVGQAPVTEFRVLITVFVLAIGPGNYWLLKRTNRLHLLVLTVPLMAAVLTIGLFGYALVSDGFSTLARVHSYTALDQRSGEAVCWARLSYYSGLAPSRGLAIPDDVAVYPILAGWNEGSRHNPYQVERQMEWRAGDERGELMMTQGWLRSRTPTQYLTVRARKSPHRLALRMTEGGLSAANELSAEIHYVAATDDDGNYFVGHDIADNARQVLKPATRLEVLEELRPLVRKNAPEMPAALAEDSSFVTMQRRQQRRWYRSRLGLDYCDEQLDDNLASDAIRSLVGIEGQPAQELPPRSYVAITETGPEVALGVPNAKVEASFHVVLGKW